MSVGGKSRRPSQEKILEEQNNWSTWINLFRLQLRIKDYPLPLSHFNSFAQESCVWVPLWDRKDIVKLLANDQNFVLSATMLMRRTKILLLECAAEIYNFPIGLWFSDVLEVCGTRWKLITIIRIFTIQAVKNNKRHWKGNSEMSFHFFSFPFLFLKFLFVAIDYCPELITDSYRCCLLPTDLLKTKLQMRPSVRVDLPIQNPLNALCKIYSGANINIPRYHDPPGNRCRANWNDALHYPSICNFNLSWPRFLWHASGCHDRLCERIQFLYILSRRLLRPLDMDRKQKRGI